MSCPNSDIQELGGFSLCWFVAELTTVAPSGEIQTCQFRNISILFYQNFIRADLVPLLRVIDSSTAVFDEHDNDYIHRHVNYPICAKQSFFVFCSNNNLHEWEGWIYLPQFGLLLSRTRAMYWWFLHPCWWCSICRGESQPLLRFQLLYWLLSFCRNVQLMPFSILNLYCAYRPIQPRVEVT